jgi:hypothetical protein
MSGILPKLVLFFFLSFPLFADSSLPEGAIYAPSDNSKSLASLVENPQVIHSEVSWVEDSQNPRLIDMVCDTQSVCGASLDKLCSTLEDLAHYPKIFNFCFDSAPVGNQVKLTGGIKAMGVLFKTSVNLVLREGNRTNSKAYYVFDFLSSDGVVDMLRVEFYFQEVQLNGRSYCYVRMSDYADIKRIAPFQKLLMSIFIDSIHKGFINNLTDAAQGKPKR